MSSELYKNDLFVNPNIPFLFNTEIIEYDMRNGGFSITKEFGLLPEEKIKELDKMNKEERKVALGKIQRSNPSYKEATKVGFRDARQLFFELNELEDSDIISVKKDAIFTTKHVKTTKVGKYIEFRPKNWYTSYIQLRKNLELYYNPNQIDVKGIRDDLLKYHENYLLKTIKMFFHKMETEDHVTVIEYMKRFIDKYKRRELEAGYYRQFDNKSELVFLEGRSEEYLENYDDIKADLDITYNYFEVLLKLIQIPL